MNKVVVIPIKTNNQRLPGKNTMMLGDKPLYQHLFDTVVKCDNIDKIYVDSSDKEILKIAESFGFDTFLRNADLNGPETSGNDLIQNFLEEIDCDILGQFFVTTPFLSSKTIDRSFEILIENEHMDSCFGLYEVHDRFWIDNKPVNHAMKKLVGTQFMKPLKREAGFYVFRRKPFLKERSRITNNFCTFDVGPNECVDIDTFEDFLYAEAIYNNIMKNEN